MVGNCSMVLPSFGKIMMLNFSLANICTARWLPELKFQGSKQANDEKSLLLWRPWTSDLYSNAGGFPAPKCEVTKIIVMEACYVIGLLPFHVNRRYSHHWRSSTAWPDSLTGDWYSLRNWQPEFVSNSLERAAK